MSMKVLLVESDFRFARQVGEYLEARAHHVSSESTQTGVMERVSHWRPDLVILSADIAEQGVLASLQALPDRPAVLLTEHMDRYDRAWRAWQLGGDDLLLKPILSYEDLRAGIMMALQNWASGWRKMRAVRASA
jgi:DNA-binding response OmpR family regulator